MHIMPITNMFLVTLKGSTLKLCKSKLKLYFMLLDWRFIYKCNTNTVFCCDYCVTLNEKCIAEIKMSDSIEIVLSCILRPSQTRFWSHFKLVSQNCVNQNLNCILCCKSEEGLFTQPRITWHFSATIAWHWKKNVLFK